MIHCGKVIKINNIEYQCSLRNNHLGHHIDSNNVVWNKDGGLESYFSNSFNGLDVIAKPSEVPTECELAFSKIVMPIDGKDIGPAWYFKQGWDAREN